MLKNYFKTALRNVWRHKGNTFINIAGLMVGFATFLLIFLVIAYEQSFDNFHTDKNSIYRVVRMSRETENRGYRTGVPVPVIATLRSEFPQLKNVAAIMDAYDVQANIAGTNGATMKKFKEPHVVFAEPTFFQMFDFPLVQGNMQALAEPNTALLTKSVAAKFFGSWQNAVNKTFRMYDLDITVSGILTDPPSNTDFPLGVVLSYITFVKMSGMDNWSAINDANYCFVQLNENASTGQFASLLDGFVTKYIKPVDIGYILALQPLDEIHFDERYGNFTGHIFSKDLIVALSLIGLFLLVIACINFINLTTAHALNRAREVGVRKVLGSSRSQLMIQFLGETGIITLLALLSSILVVYSCVPLVADFLDISLSMSVFLSKELILFVACAFVIVTLLSGLYPALVLSGFKPVFVLKGVLKSTRHGISFRRGLVVFQFVIAQVLIIGTLVIASQMNYFRTADMGFTKEAILNAGVPGDSLSQTKLELLRDELTRIPGIQQVSFSTFTPSVSGGWAADLRTESNHNPSRPDMIVAMRPADTSYFRLYNLSLVAGRIYFPSDTIREFVVNETVVRNLGISNPADVIGKRVKVAGKTAPIVGVVKDFHPRSLHAAIDPVVMTTMKNEYGLANIHISMSQAKNVIMDMQKIWAKYYPEYIFEYDFLDQSIASYYRQENRLSTLYSVFSGIAIFISCLGLYGLISFMAVQRRKEIGIRKVLGAPVSDIVLLLSKEFTLLIVIAFLVATPIAWYFMQQWLQQYTYRISIGIGFFAATLLGALVIAWITVGYTAVKAALANPVKSLRSQ
ncbi:ABC transporter permease [Cytophagaceae bacterium DM2B3-1]|uniref:ABC transporter permease n=1 Tax=Xanthocytophaga flava TaxID=3048013 RepID=A0ABT7CY78_9BACT|nr:ABC transporter permease [Xanthocytophaga flavus]MDJ1466788.1 ABC transporter permease [Xanthocytophaga flavus]MDJ1498735.1 ABC transporter permease [Xanthocytophaga flavus]